MYELIRLTDSTYYIESPAKVGVFVRRGEATLIDSGNDKDAGKKILKCLNAEGWQLRAILLTHAHADHMGGCRYLQQNTGCKVYGYGLEQAYAQYPLLEPSLLWGGNPPGFLRHKFLLAQSCEAEPLCREVLPEGMTLLPLPGHTPDMVGFRTEDGVVFLGDCLSGEATLEKYKIGYLYDVAAYLQSLEQVKCLEGNCFVPAHGVPASEIAPLAQHNIDTVEAIGDLIVGLCRIPRSFEELLADLFDALSLTMTFEQYALVGSALRAYLTWLNGEGRLTASIEQNRMIWSMPEE